MNTGKIMKGITAGFAGIIMLVAWGCGGGGGSDAQAPTASAPPVEGAQILPTAPTVYSDGRLSAVYRLPVTDYGVVLKHGSAANGEDYYGARDVTLYQENGTFYMTYDGAGINVPGWNLVMASSTDMVNWTTHGNMMLLGSAGSLDSACVCYGIIAKDAAGYHMYYTSAINGSTNPPVPFPNYDTMYASAPSITGPWTKSGGLVFNPDQYARNGINSGGIIQYNGQYLQFASAGAKQADGKWSRYIQIARSSVLDGTSWTIDPTPAMTPSEQLENAVVWYQQETGTYFAFTDHVGIHDGTEYTDAIWMYWTQDPTHWDMSKKAVVMDASTSNWSKYDVGIPAVTRVGNRLALLYDGNSSPTFDTGLAGNLNRDIGLAWIQLPIRTPS